MKFLFLKILDLHKDQDSNDVIDQTIRNGSLIAGTNLWVLMFAIAIASVGLNVNSSAVIIGAMLISPLMGPIICIGYGAGINDFGLVRAAGRSLGIFVIISLITSAIYFLITPLSEAHSELLARTYPTIWDVLIAFFGGSAGILAITRKERSAVIPGVAIATALMPPLCTAGYGLATLQPAFFFGAFYLFIINAVFIAFSTLIFVKLLKLPQHSFLNQFDQKRSRIWVVSILLFTMLPSGWLAYRMVHEELFTASAQRYVHELEKNDQLILLERKIDAKNRSISLVMYGKDNGDSFYKQQQSKLPHYGLTNTTLNIRMLKSGDFQGALANLKNEIQQDIASNLLKSSDIKNAQIRDLEEQIYSFQSVKKDQEKLFRELNAQYQSVTDLQLATGTMHFNNQQSLMVQVWSSHDFSNKEKKQINAWLSARYSDRPVYVYFELKKKSTEHMLPVSK